MILCLLRLFNCSNSIAQEAGARHYTTKDGLPSGTIYSILSDSKGYLWFGTDAGVSRFDGHQFTNFTLSDGLSDNEVMKVAEDSKGRIWFLGFSGTLCYYLNGKFANPSNDPVLKKAKISNTYFLFYEDSQNRLWFSNYMGYTMIDKDSVKIFEHATDHIMSSGFVIDNSWGSVEILTPYNKSLLDSSHGLFEYAGSGFLRHIVPFSKNTMSRLCYLPDKSALFVSDNGIVLQKDTTQKLILSTNGELVSIKILGVELSSDGLLWVQTNSKGIFCYDYNDCTKKPKRYFENIGIADVKEDIQHNIWIATFGDGVYILTAGYKAIQNHFKDHRVYCVTKDGDGNIYTGLDDLTINVLKNGISKTVSLEKTESEFINNRVNKLLIYKDNIWAGADGGLVHISGSNENHTITKARRVIPQFSGIERSLGNVRYVKDIVSYNNRIFVCTNVSILRQDTTSHANDVFTDFSTVLKRHYCVFADKQGIIWSGVTDGLYSNNGKSEINHAPESSYLSGSIYDIGEAADSALVLASYGYGILLYKDGKILQHLTENDGISSNLCKRIFVHGDNIYVATANGATQITYNKGHIDAIKKFTNADGLLSNMVNDIYADDSEICFATSDGLTVLNTRLNTEKIGLPIVYITAIKCKGKQLLVDSNYTFRHDQNSMQFTFTGISYRSPDDVIYQYRLAEEQPWAETKNTSIDFPSLQQGTYHFQLRAKILNGPWSGVRSFYFSINPPFWRTYSFAFLCAFTFIIVVILIAVYLLKRRKHKDLAELKIKDQVAYLEQQALQAMMNPHFIFNVMNSIQHYINNNEKHEANLYLADFAKLIRINLDISSKRYIPLDEEVIYLELYLALESLRFGNGLTYKIDISPDIDRDETMIPVMLLQPFIENAIWHGILPKKSAGHVGVEIKKETNGMLKIIITDNGVGMQSDTATGIKTHLSRGMNMTQQRLDLISRITGQELYIHINDAFPNDQFRGTSVEFLLPGNLA